jgi:hypothetical protein
MQRFLLASATLLVATGAFAATPSPAVRQVVSTTVAAPTGGMDCSTPRKTIESQREDGSGRNADTLWFK